MPHWDDINQWIAENPQWSPDSQWISYRMRMGSDEHWEVSVWNPKNGCARKGHLGTRRRRKLSLVPGGAQCF